MKILILCLAVAVEFLKRVLNDRITLLRNTMMKKISSMSRVLEISNQLVNLLGYANWIIYIELLFSQSNRLWRKAEKPKKKVCYFCVQCAGTPIKFYCIMSSLNDVFSFVEIAEIYLPKEQYNASMLISSLILLGINGLQNSTLNHFLAL